MKKLLPKRIICISVCMTLFGLLLSGGGVLADTAFSTYTYSYEGKELPSPDAYRFGRSITAADLGAAAFHSPKDIFADADGAIYVADSGNNRVVVLNPDYTVREILSGFTDPAGNADEFSAPGGVFAASGSLYVADTGNGRLLEFSTADFSLKRVLEKPDSELLAGYVYTPDSLVVDEVGRIYAVSSGVNMGVVSLDADGTFLGFLGAKRVRSTASDQLWKVFMSKEQKAAAVKLVPSSYNNIAIDSSGFLYVTTNTYEDWEIQYYINQRMKDDLYAPVRRLNATGLDVLKRQGFFPPAGEVRFDTFGGAEDGASRIVDVALDGTGIYTLLDQKRGKLFSYDQSGNLLFTFGGIGVQDGLTVDPVSVVYQGTNLLLLDGKSGSISVFQQTQYGALFQEAMLLTRKRSYSEAAEKWNEILKYNQNSEIAYAAMGQNYLMDEQYSEALRCFKIFRDRENYSEAFAELRKEALRIWAIPLVLLLAGLCVLAVVVFGKIGRFNKSTQNAAVVKRTKHHLLYAQYIIFHPFDGFYDMKHERRGGVKAATLILAFTVFSFIMKDLCTGFLFSGSDSLGSGLWGSLLTVLVPFVLWCVSNWCFTSLMNGEGRLVDIYMAACYALVPMALVNLPVALLSNVLTLPEGAVLSLLITVFYGWSFVLVVLGCMTIHRTTFGKALLTVLLTVLGMAVILFIAFLFINVIQKMLGFVINIYNEVAFRL